MRWLAAFVIAAALPSVAPAQDATEAQMVALVAQARSRGCAAHAGVNTPLRWSPPLARALVRMDKGEPALQAAGKEGFRATRIFHIDFENYRSPAEVVKAMAQFYCTALVEPAFTDIGLHRKGPKWFVAMASRLEFPQLADRRAVLVKVLALTNEARAHARRCGDRHFAPAPPLQVNEQLADAAQLHAKDMAAHQYLEHAGRDGTTPAQRAMRTGYRWRAIGENIAAGQAAADDVVEDWLSSPGHCANIMNPEFVDMGVAFAMNMDSRAVVYWAQEFGRAAK